LTLKKHSVVAKTEVVTSTVFKIILTAIGLSPGGSGYFTCTQIWKEKVTVKFK
jgi:hypothetical protein